MAIKLIASTTNHERTFSRDLSYSLWHRQFQGLAFVDIDQVEMCKACKEPLALVETARDVGQDIFTKNATVTTNIARRIELPAFVLLYKVTHVTEKITGFRVIQTAPRKSTAEKVITPEQWANQLRHLHRNHDETSCRRRSINTQRTFEIRNQHNEVLAACTEMSDGSMMVHWHRTRFSSFDELSSQLDEVRLTVRPTNPMRSAVTSISEFAEKMQRAMDQKKRQETGEAKKAA